MDSDDYREEGINLSIRLGFGKLVNAFGIEHEFDGELTDSTSSDLSGSGLLQGYQRLQRLSLVIIVKWESSDLPHRSAERLLGEGENQPLPAFSAHTSLLLLPSVKMGCISFPGIHFTRLLLYSPEHNSHLRDFEAVPRRVRGTSLNVVYTART